MLYLYAYILLALLSTCSLDSSMAVSTIPSSISFLKDDRGEFIPVSCGQLVGKLYMVKLRNALGHKGSCKCIFYNDQWVSPADFENQGGKTKCKNWKKSIYCGDKHLLSIYAQLVPETQNRESLPLNSQKEDGGPSESRGQPLLTNTILAFVKAHRLKGELSNLKRLVADRFDPLM